MISATFATSTGEFLRSTPSSLALSSVSERLQALGFPYFGFDSHGVMNKQSPAVSPTCSVSLDACGGNFYGQLEFNVSHKLYETDSLLPGAWHHFVYRPCTSRLRLRQKPRLLTTSRRATAPARDALQDEGAPADYRGQKQCRHYRH